MEVACGQCVGCRIDRSRMWATRIVHESTLHEHSYGSSFVTLTYRNPVNCDERELRENLYVPDDWSLNKKHGQDFIKRLRQSYVPGRRGDRKALSNGQIRYFFCGEYGSVCRHGNKDRCAFGCTVGRPHYHAILFGITFMDLVPFKQVDGQTYYTSPELEKIWGYGFVQVGEVTFQSAAYVARYCMKKINGKEAEQAYQNVDLETGEVNYVLPEYAVMSRRPGLGAGWFERYSTDCFPSDEVPVPGRGVQKKVPRYYEKLYEEYGHELELEEIKLARIKHKKEHADDYTRDRLIQREKVKRAQVDQLKRNLET